jgi:hypothetical protein
VAECGSVCAAAEANGSRRVKVSSKTVALGLLQLLVTCVLLYAIAVSIDRARLATLIANADLRWLGIAFALTLLQQLMAAERWKMIASVLNVPRHPRWFYVFWQGVSTLFSLILPSMIGADLARSYALARRTPLGVVARIIFADRASGLLALGSLVLIGTLPNTDLLRNPVLLFPIGIAIGGLIAYVVLTRWFANLTSDNMILRSGHFVGSDLKEIIETRRGYRVILLSLSIHFTSILVFASFALAFGVAPNFVRWFLIVPAVLLITIVPISLGGWGLREGAFVVGLGLISVPAETAVTLSVMFGIFQILTAIVIALLSWPMLLRHKPE